MAYEDLLKDTSKPDPDNKDYFLLTVTDLDPGKTYPIQLRWVYNKDKASDDQEWSVVENLITPAELINAPQFITGDLYGGEGFLRITWNGKDYLGNSYTNLDRVEVFIEDSNGFFDHGNKAVTFFKSAGSTTITCPAGSYTVWLKAVTPKKTYSSASNSLSTSVTSIGFVVEQPNLPVGLSAATTAFGITINWSGAYQNDDPFYGFKTIAIYATTNATLGASTTTAFTSTALVGNLNVTQTVNRINIGIDNLKQALGLTTSEQVYNAGVYFYYIAYNTNNDPYKVGGVATYTRINSTPLSPTKANLIDLQSGLISIENLVAGNGQFTSWLRTGTAGGARIELSGTSAFTNNGYTVLPGLTVYSSGNTPIFRASLDGSVLFGGYSPSDITAISNTASSASSTASSAASSAASKATVFRQGTTPTSLAAKDIWINTADTTAGRNTIYVAAAANVSTIATGAWEVSKDLDINTALSKAGAFDLNGNINRAIQIPVPNGVAAGSIASVKTGYGLAETGWYIGWDGISASSKPVVDIGSSTKYLRWDGTDLQIRGQLKTTGDVGSYTGNTLTIDGGKITADKIIQLDSSRVDSTGQINIFSDYVQISAGINTEIFGNIKMSGDTNFYNAATFNNVTKIGFDQTSYVGASTTSMVRNIYINPNLIGTTSSTGKIGDVWLQYA